MRTSNFTKHKFLFIYFLNILILIQNFYLVKYIQKINKQKRTLEYYIIDGPQCSVKALERLFYSIMNVMCISPDPLRSQIFILECWVSIFLSKHSVTISVEPLWIKYSMISKFKIQNSNFKTLADQVDLLKLFRKTKIITTSEKQRPQFVILENVKHSDKTNSKWVY